MVTNMPDIRFWATAFFLQPNSRKYINFCGSNCKSHRKVRERKNVLVIVSNELASFPPTLHWLQRTHKQLLPLTRNSKGSSQNYNLTYSNFHKIKNVLAKKCIKQMWFLYPTSDSESITSESIGHDEFDLFVLARPRAFIKCNIRMCRLTV